MRGYCRGFVVSGGLSVVSDVHVIAVISLARRGARGRDAGAETGCALPLGRDPLARFDRGSRGRRRVARDGQAVIERQERERPDVTRRRLARESCLPGITRRLEDRAVEGVDVLQGFIERIVKPLAVRPGGREVALDVRERRRPTRRNRGEYESGRRDRGRTEETSTDAT